MNTRRREAMVAAFDSMRRILIIGSAGAGKSTLARRLGERLGLAVIHLDAHYWQPNWVETPRAEWATKQADFVRGERWIIDGNYGGTLDLRLAACDTVIFLDLPRRLCLWRALVRRIRYAGQTRPDMGPGCPEKIDWAFVKWIWNFPTRSRGRIVAKLGALPEHVQVIQLRSPQDVAQFLAACPTPPCPPAHEG